ncbi:MAG: hypothetical protein WCF94_04345 [bacterium]
MSKMDQIISKGTRPAFASVVFSINECISGFDTLSIIDKLHRKISGFDIKQRHKFFSELGLFIDPEIDIGVLLGMVRDCFCVRLANLADKRKDVHSLRKYFKGKIIDDLFKHPIVCECISARNNNIAHLGKRYIKWPESEDITRAKDLRLILEMIKVSVMSLKK